MMNRRRELPGKLAIVSFTLIFLGYSFLYLSRFSPLIPFNVPFGFSHLVFGAFVIILPSVFFFHFPRLLWHEVLFLFWIFFALVFSSFSILNGAPSHSFLTQLTGFSQAVGLWLVFRSLDLQNQMVAKISLTALVVSGWAVFSIPSTVTIFNAHLLSYHTAAFVIFLTGFVVVTQARQVYGIAFLIAALVFLYVNGARTEFYLLAAIGPVLVLKKLGGKALLLCSILFPVSLLVLASNLGSLIDHDGASRIIGLLDSAEDRSYTVRSVILHDSIETILQHPILGDYASYEQGYYSHNALSAWVDFGLLGFVVYLACVLVVLKNTIRIFVSNSEKHMPLLMLVCAFVLSIILSKAFHHPMIGCVVGILSATLLREKVGEKQ